MEQREFAGKIWKNQHNVTGHDSPRGGESGMGMRQDWRAKTQGMGISWK